MRPKTCPIANQEALKFYWRAARNYYTMPLMELSLRPRDHHDLFPAACARLTDDGSECHRVISHR